MDQAQTEQQGTRGVGKNEKRWQLISLGSVTLCAACVSILARWQTLDWTRKFTAIAFVLMLSVGVVSEFMAEKGGNEFFVRNRLPSLAYILILLSLMSIAKP